MGLALWLALVLTAVPGAAAETSSSLFIYRETDIGRESHLFRSGVDQIWAFDSTNPPVDIDAVGTDPAAPSNSRDASVQLAAPPGQKLRVGSYNDARTLFNTATQPGIYVSRDGETDGSFEGNFVIKDIAYSSPGRLQRLWAIFEERCTCAAWFTFGEVRLGMPDPDPAMLLRPTEVHWPPAYLGRGSVPVPVTVVARGTPLRVANAAIGGASPGQFEITRDDCAGRTIPAGGTCEVWVRFDPSSEGSKSAVLQIRDASGGAHPVPLAGRVAGGRTRLVMTSGPNNGVGAGRSYSYTPLNSDISIDGVREGVNFRLFGRPVEAGDFWIGQFIPPQGRTLVPGRFPNAVRPISATPSQAKMEVVGQGRGCNTLRGEFTVEHSAFAPDGRLSQLGLSFTQYCDTDTDPLTGRFEYHAGGTTPPLDPGVPSPDAPDVVTDPPFLPWVPAACGKRRYGRTLRGTRRRDRIVGTASSELLRGGRGNDLLRGAGGADCLSGSTGRDKLRGGPGRDVLIGGPGRDRLICGPGRDVAIASRRDVVRGCERVR